MRIIDSNEKVRQARLAGFRPGIYWAFVHPWCPASIVVRRGASSPPDLTAPIGEDGYEPATIFAQLRRFSDHEAGGEDSILADPLERLLIWKRVDGPRNRGRHRPQFERVLGVLEAAGFIESQGPTDGRWTSIRILCKTPQTVTKPKVEEVGRSGEEEGAQLSPWEQMVSAS